MPRVALNPEFRVDTKQPERSLGELPTALGIELPKPRKATTLIDLPKKSSHPLVTTEETRDKIASSIEAEYARRKEEGMIDDENIRGLAYQPHAGGRPSDYNKKFPRIVYEFALVGLSDDRIAQAMGVCIKTFHNWKEQHPEFLQALVDGRENADRQVANAMFKRAVGFKYPAVRIFHNKDDGTVYAPYEEYMPPDVTAGFKWMSIRRGKMRKDGWDDSTDANGNPRPVVSVQINVNDPQEAAKQYREIMQLEGTAE